jgi:beta-glucosidase
VPTWLTLNEPKTVVTVGYQSGTHAPGIRDVAESYVVAHHQLLGHGLAVQAFRATGQAGRIGLALNLTPVYPTSPDDPPEAVRRADGFENRIYTDPIFRGAYPADVLAAAPSLGAAVREGDLAVISSPIDLLAVQYYTPLYVDPAGHGVEMHPRTDASWQQIYPDGLYDLLLWIKRQYGDIPLTITENGRPCSDTVVDGRVHDPDRIAFLRDHLAAAHRAIADGVRLESYHVWSLLDNFEWAEGYAQRWGLVYVDYATQERIEKSSAAWYRQVIARHGLA